MQRPGTSFENKTIILDFILITQQNPLCAECAEVREKR